MTHKVTWTSLPVGSVVQSSSYFDENQLEYEKPIAYSTVMNSCKLSYYYEMIIIISSSDEIAIVNMIARSWLFTHAAGAKQHLHCNFKSVINVWLFSRYMFHNVSIFVILQVWVSLLGISELIC